MMSNVALWLRTHDLSSMWTDDAKTVNAAAAGDEVFHVDDAVSNKDIDATASGRRPFLRSDATRNGSLHFTLSTAQRYFEVQDTTAYFNNFLQGQGAIMMWAKFDNADAPTTQVILDTYNVTSLGTGFTVYRVSDERIRFVIHEGGVADQLFLETTASSLADTNWHKIICKVGAGANASSLQLDDTVVQGTFGTPIAGNASQNLFVGLRAGLSLPMNGQISNLVICNAIPSDNDIALWGSYNPPLST